MTDNPGSASSSLPSNNTCMPTHTPNTGLPEATKSRIEPSSPWWQMARMHAPKWPTPGITRASAPPTSDGSPVISGVPPTRASARETEWRLPEP